MHIPIASYAPARASRQSLANDASFNVRARLFDELYQVSASINVICVDLNGYKAASSIK